jgi:hypothetical protein
VVRYLRAAESDKTVGSIEDEPSVPAVPDSTPPSASHTEEDLFATAELMEELKSKDKAFGKRGEVYVICQVALIALVIFPPFAIKVGVGSGLPALPCD